MLPEEMNLFQESTRDSVRLLPDSRQSVVDRVAAKLGLQCIGWIFTDLVAEDVSKGTVRHFRNSETHFLSAQECIMAGHFQSLHPNPCRLSSDGFFGSKFVTVCVTGTFHVLINTDLKLRMEICLQVTHRIRCTWKVIRFRINAKPQFEMSAQCLPKTLQSQHTSASLHLKSTSQMFTIRSVTVFNDYQYLSKQNMSEKIRVDSDRYVYFSIQVSLQFPRQMECFFFFFFFFFLF